MAKTFQSTICDQPSIEILANFYQENTTHKYVVSNIFYEWNVIFIVK